MATATPPDKENREDNFQLELSRVRKEIESVFAELIHCLESRKKHLFDELNDILIRYQSYKNETEELTKRKVELDKLTSQIEVSILLLLNLYKLLSLNKSTKN